jgi:hypothetical protein
MGKQRSGGGGDCYPTPEIYGKYTGQHALSYWPVTDRNGPCKILEPGCGSDAPFIAPFRQRAGEWLSPEQRRIMLLDAFDCTGVDITPPAPESPPGNNSDIFTIYRGQDFLQEGPWRRHDTYDLIITNPPFSLAEEFIRRSLNLLDEWGVAVFLLRMGVAGTAQRLPLFEKRPPVEISMFVRRISFDGISTDYSEYALFTWLGASLNMGYQAAKAGTRFTWVDNTSTQLKNHQCLRKFG